MLSLSIVLSCKGLASGGSSLPERSPRLQERTSVLQEAQVQRCHCDLDGGRSGGFSY